MPARSRHEAARAIVHPLSLSASCLARSIIEDVSDRSANFGRMRFPEGLPVRLRGRYPLSFTLMHAYRISSASSGWRTEANGYSYQIYAAVEREIVAFHWHPDRGPVTTPHAHFRQLNDPIPMGKIHVPTGRISLPTVVRFLVEELDVLAEAERALEHVASP